MKKQFLALLFFPLISSSVRVESNTGNNVIINGNGKEIVTEGKAESEIVTEINGKKTIVKTDKPGTLEVNVNEEKTEIKTSEGITPTIIKVQPAESVLGENKEIKEINSIFISIKKFFSNIFSSIFNKT